MKYRNKGTSLSVIIEGPRWRAVTFAILACGAALLTAILLSTTLGHAASVPAWLDDAISESNQENPSNQIQFVDIKDSYVWYMIHDTPEIAHQDIRHRIYELVKENGYKMTEVEELITTGKPPSPNRPYEAKKCWTRSFLLELEVGRQRLLTTLVCEDGPYWFAGFRIVG